MITFLLAFGALAGLVMGWVLILAETALGFISTRQAQEITEAHPKNPVLKVLDDLPAHMVALQFWRLFAQASATVLATLLVWHLSHKLWVTLVVMLIAMAGVAALWLFASPRTIASKHDAASARFTAGLVHNLRRISGGFATKFGELRTPDEEDDDDDEDDFEERHFREYVSRANQANVLEDEEAEVIQSVFDMDDTIVRAVMVPRTDVVWLNSGAPISEALDMFITSGNSRIPLIGEGPDDILGLVYLKDLVRVLHTGQLSVDDPVDSTIRQARFVPESKTVWDLLQELQHEAAQVAIVIDEYGGTAGLVTLEDLIEELVGEIADEYDEEEIEEVIPLPEGDYLISAKMSVSDFADYFELTMEDDTDVDTVGGLFAKYLGNIPSLGARTTIEDLSLRVESLQGRRNRINSVRVTPDAADTTEPEDHQNEETS